MSWTRAASESEIRNEGKRLFRSGKYQIVLFAVGDRVHALDNRCPHEGYPLIQGSVDPKDCLLTCQWHNWKFHLETGECVLGEDHVRSYPTRIDAGDVFVDLTDPSLEALEARTLEGLDGGLEDRQYGRIAREISRLLVNGIDPLVAVRRAIARTYDRFEFGTTHAFAASADWLTLYRRESDVERKVVCLTEALDHMAHDALRHPSYPYVEDEQAFDGASLLDAIEAEDEPRAVRLVRGAMREGRQWPELEPWLARAAFEHYNDFGHAAIYVHKTGELLGHVGGDELPRLALPLTRMLCYTTRDDLLPDFAAYGEMLAKVPPALGRDDAWLDEGTPFGYATRDGLRWVIDRLATHTPEVVLSALLSANALNLLAFDESFAVAAKRSVSQNVSWLFFTHGFTFGNAARHLCERHPALWPKALLQMVCFVGRVKRFVRSEADVERWQAGEQTAFFARAIDRVLDHGLGEPILASHLLKTTIAVQDEVMRVSPACARLLMAALNRFLSARIKEKHPLRTARQALALVGR